MAKKSASESRKVPAAGKRSAFVDTRVIYCGDNLEQLKKLSRKCVDLIYIDPPFNSNRNYEESAIETSKLFDSLFLKNYSEVGEKQEK
jgi:DNA modification methylase